MRIIFVFLKLIFISCGNNGGKSHISYKPYGEILRTDSSGPDISKFKFTGQEEDKESSLLYYKARYYDPVIGRFLQADSVIMPKSTCGMNRYMYVEGNPVRYGDDSGHSKIGNFFSNLGKDMMGGVKWAAKSMKGGAEWASGGLHRAGDAYNTFTGNRKYQGKNDFQRGDLKTAFDPAFWLGAIWTGLNLLIAYGSPYGWINMAIHRKPTWVEYRDGAFITHNAPLNFGGAMTLGPFVTMNGAQGEDTLLHELGHVKQWREWGGWKYLGHTMTSPFGGARWAERNANHRSGTNAYAGTARDNLSYELLINYAAITGNFILLFYAYLVLDGKYAGLSTK